MGIFHKKPLTNHLESVDFVDHIDHWLEYLTELLDSSDKATRSKLERQIRYLLGFRAGTNCNINHNQLLLYYYSNKAEEAGDEISSPAGNYNAKDVRSLYEQTSESKAAVDDFITEFKAREGTSSISIHPTKPIQDSYQPDDPAFKLILKALASKDLFFMQGPPGTGKTTAIVEIILQLINAKPKARILICSETHVAVDNALDRLARTKSLTFDECAKAYIEANRAGWKNEKHVAQWENTLNTYVSPIMGKLPVDLIDTGLVLKVLEFEQLWTTKPETASRVRGRIEAVLGWATVRKYRTGDNPAQWKNHLDKVLPSKSSVAKVEHHPALPFPQIGSFTENRAEAGFVIVTDDASGGMLDIHDRRPVVLDAQDAGRWLDPALTSEEALALARSAALPADAFAWHQVSSQVNRAGAGGPEVALPIDNAA